MIDNPHLHLTGSHDNGIEIIVAELSSNVAKLLVVAEHSAVGVPLTHGGRVGTDGLHSEHRCGEIVYSEIADE